MGMNFTYCWPSKRSVITVLLPGLVEALDKLLEESMRLVENGKSQDVDSVIQQAVQALEGKLLQEPKTENRIREENRHQNLQNHSIPLKRRWDHAATGTCTLEPTTSKVELKSTRWLVRKSLVLTRT